MSSQLTRVLVAHPDERTRRALVESLKRLGGGPTSVSESESLTRAIEAAGRLEPTVVFVDLAEQPELALEVARDLRRVGRTLVGLYNPLVLGEGAVELFRRASRAGFGDFVPLPASDAEIEAVLAAAGDAARTEERSEGRLVTFLSPQGGAGTTTLATSTALVLAASGLVEGEVALCDAQASFGNAAAYLGLAPDRDLADLVRELDQPRSFSTYLTVQAETGLRVLAAARDILEGEAVGPAELGRVLIELRRRHHTVVVDLDSRFDLLSIAALDLSETVVVVTEPLAPTVMATTRLLELLERLGYGDRVRVVVNRDGELKGGLDAELVAERLGRPVDRVVPYDPEVLAGVNRGVPLVVSDQRGEFAEAIGELARDLVGGHAAGPDA